MGRLYAQIFPTDKDCLWLTELNLLSREEKIRPQYVVQFKGVKKVIFHFLPASQACIEIYTQAALLSSYSNLCLNGKHLPTSVMEYLVQMQRLLHAVRKGDCVLLIIVTAHNKGMKPI